MSACLPAPGCIRDASLWTLALTCLLSLSVSLFSSSYRAKGRVGYTLLSPSFRASMASANAGVGVRAHRISDGPNPHQQQYVSVLPSSSAAGPATAVPIFAVSGSSGRPTLRQRSYTNPSFSTSSVSASTLPSVSHHYAGSAATLAAEAAAKAQQQAAQTQAPPVNSYGGGFQSFGNASPTGAVPPSPIGSRRPSAAQFSTYSTTTSVTSPISSRPPQIPLPAGLSAVNRSPSSPSLASVARQQQFLTLQPQPPLHQKPQPPPPPPPPPPPHLAPSSTDERSNARDSILSIASIVNDPFFQRYHGAEAVAAEQRFQQQLELDSSPGLELRRQRSQAALPPTPFSPPGGSTKPTAASAAQTPLQQAQQQLPPTPPPKEPLPPPPPAKQQLPPLPLQQPPPPPQQQLPPLPPNPRQMSMSSGAAQRHERKPQVPTLNPRRDSLPARDSHIWVCGM